MLAASPGLRPAYTNRLPTSYNIHQTSLNLLVLTSTDLLPTSDLPYVKLINLAQPLANLSSLVPTLY